MRAARTRAGALRDRQEGRRLLPVPGRARCAGAWQGLQRGAAATTTAEEIGRAPDRGLRATARSTSCTSRTRTSVPRSRSGRPTQRFLPIAPEEVDGDRRRAVRAEYLFEPEPEEILDHLLPQYVVTKVYAALLESAASENAARRRAMKAATDNAEELIKILHPAGEPRPPGRDHHRDHARSSAGPKPWPRHRGSDGRWQRDTSARRTRQRAGRPGHRPRGGRGVPARGAPRDQHRAARST